MLRLRDIVVVLLMFMLAGCTLTHAVKNGDLDAVKKYIEEGADINQGASDRRPGVQTPKILGPIATKPKKEKYRSGRTPLILAAYYGNLPIVEYLIEKGAGLDYQDYSGFTAMMYGAYYGKLAIVKALVEAGADKDIKCNKGYTAYDYARMYAFTDIADYLKSDH